MSYSSSTPSSIRTLFNRIAPRYETGNLLMSFGTYRLWNRTLIRETLGKKPARYYLDLCAGTGEIALAYLAKEKRPIDAHLLDFSEGMLELAKKRAEKIRPHSHTLHFHHADAESIPLPDESIDCVTVAYGIRNIHSPENCFREVQRVLKPGGRFGILELTRPKNRLLALLHRLYLKLALPTIGRYLTRDKAAYEYLSSSIHQFKSPEILQRDLETLHFQNVRMRPLFGGIATLITADKIGTLHAPPLV